MLKFLVASVVHLPKFKSNHCPILLKFEREGRDLMRSPKSFRFFAPWVTHSEFNDVVKRSWINSNEWDYNVPSFIANIQE